MEGNKLTVPAANAPLRETKEAQEKREKAAKRRKTGKREGWLSTAPQGSQPASVSTAGGERQRKSLRNANFPCAFQHRQEANINRLTFDVKLIQKLFSSTGRIIGFCGGGRPAAAMLRGGLI